MRETCDHEAGICWLEPRRSWGFGVPPPTSAELDQLHRKEEAQFKELMDEIHRNASENLSETSSQVDPEEQENIMNDCPSPTHKLIRFWNPEYEARRQACKRLWSLTLTPEPRGKGCRPRLPHDLPTPRP